MPRGMESFDLWKICLRGKSIVMWDPEFWCNDKTVEKIIPMAVSVKLWQIDKWLLLDINMKLYIASPIAPYCFDLF